MYMALTLKKETGEIAFDIPCEGTVRKVMAQIGLIHKPRRKPNGITKADREARKSDDLLKRNFKADKPEQIQCYAAFLHLVSDIFIVGHLVHGL